MSYTCTRRRAAQFGCGLALTALCASRGLLGVGIGSAPARAWAADESDEIRWPEPQAPLPATDRVTASAKGTYIMYPLWLGITNTVCDMIGGSGMTPDNLTADMLATNNLFGTFASPVNTDPQAYISNLWYSILHPEMGLSPANRDEVALLCTGQPAVADTTISIGGTSNSLYYRPDIIVGGGSKAGESGSGAVVYGELVAAINDGSIGADNYIEGDEAYDPYIMDGWNAYEGNPGFQGTVRGTCGMLYNLAGIAERVKEEHPEKTTAYGNDCQALAEQYEELFLGVQCAIRKAIDTGEVPCRILAVCDGVDKDTMTATVSYADPTHQLGNINELAFAPQFAMQDITDNLCWLMSGGEEPTDTVEVPEEEVEEQQGADAQGGSGSGAGGAGANAGAGASSEGAGAGAGANAGGAAAEGAGAGAGANAGGSGSGSGGAGAPMGGGTSTAGGGSIRISLAELAQADLVIYTSQNQTNVPQSDVEEAFAAAGIADVPLGVYVNPKNIGSGNYDADKGAFFLNWMGAAYPEVVSATDLLAYYYSRIDHVSDDNLANVVALNCANMTLVGDDSLSRDNSYFAGRVEAVQALIEDGLAYLAENLDAIVAEHLNLEPVKDAAGTFRDRRFQ